MWGARVRITGTLAVVLWEAVVAVPSVLVVVGWVLGGRFEAFLNLGFECNRHLDKCLVGRFWAASSLSRDGEGSYG